MAEDVDEPITPEAIALVRATIADEGWDVDGIDGFGIDGGTSALGVIRGLLALLDQPRNLTALNAVLRPQGIHLAAYLTDHERHALAGETHSACAQCMGEALWRHPDLQVGE